MACNFLDCEEITFDTIGGDVIYYCDSCIQDELLVIDQTNVSPL